MAVIGKYSAGICASCALSSAAFVKNLPSPVLSLMKCTNVRPSPFSVLMFLMILRIVMGLSVISSIDTRLQQYVVAATSLIVPSAIRSAKDFI